MEIIDELEPTKRGVYAGAIMYVDFSNNLDSCIAIRTWLCAETRDTSRPAAALSPIPFRKTNTWKR